jgi:hypothetical protein
MCVTEVGFEAAYLNHRNQGEVKCGHWEHRQGCPDCLKGIAFLGSGTTVSFSKVLICLSLNLWSCHNVEQGRQTYHVVRATSTESGLYAANTE